MNHKIRQSHPKDIAPIYKLIVDAFGGAYLSYTIYQSPESIQYLNNLISKKKHHLIVSTDAHQISGYYHAVLSKELFFLNYITVASIFAGKGVGNTLLSHYENVGAELECTQYGLDVFANNQRSQEWYLRHGYTQQSSSFLSHIILNTLVRQNSALTYKQTDWDTAHQEELLNGFSKLTCKCQDGTITIGLINGNRCKLLEYQSISFENALIAINNHFVSTQRDTLIIPSPTPLENTWSIMQQDRILRLVKNV